MKFWSNKTFAQKVAILAVFSVLALAVVGGGAAIVGRYWNTECQLNTNDADEKVKILGGVMGLSFVSQHEKPFRHDGTEGILFVGGQRDVKVFEGKEQIQVPGYEVNCMYPPFSVVEPDQRIGNPPKPLPAYCHVPPEASPSPTPATANATPTPTPGPTPQNLAADKLQGYLENRGDTKHSSYMQSVGALRVGSDPNHTEFWASGFVIAGNLFATSCHAIEPLFQKGEYGLPQPDANGHYTFNDQNKLWVDFGIGQLTPDPSSHNLIPATFKECSYQEGLDVALLTLEATELPPAFPIFYDKDFDSKVSVVPAVLIAYGDLRHPVDEITSEMYDSFVKQDANPDQYWAYRKFVMWEGIVATAQCKNVDYLLNISSTTMGSSGSPVLAVFSSSGSSPSDVLSHPLKKPLAIGVHKCCAAYFGEEEAYQSLPTIACSKLHRSPFNQDVSSISILQEPRFCEPLKKQNVQIEDYSGNQYQLECAENTVTVKKKSR